MKSLVMGFFGPIEINWWRPYLLKGCPSKDHHKHHYSLISNLGYNLQYLEFLDYQYRKEQLHFTVETMTIKTFIITSMSVIEGLAFYLLTINKHGKMKEWETEDVWISNTKKKDGVETRIRSVFEKKLETSAPDAMNLEEMIKRLKNHNLLTTMTADDYRTLSHLRKLRNKIHVYDVSQPLDTDWNSFLRKHYKDCKSVLGSILKSNLFQPTGEELAKLSWLD